MLPINYLTLMKFAGFRIRIFLCKKCLFREGIKNRRCAEFEILSSLHPRGRQDGSRERKCRYPSSCHILSYTVLLFLCHLLPPSKYCRSRNGNLIQIPFHRPNVLYGHVLVPGQSIWKQSPKPTSKVSFPLKFLVSALLFHAQQQRFRRRPTRDSNLSSSPPGTDNSFL